MLGTASKVGRFAGNALKGLFKIPGTDKYMGRTEIIGRLAPDALYSGMEFAMTPGDLADKSIAAAGSFVGGAGGGLALGRLGGKNQGAGFLLDMAGSLGGDFAGRAAYEAAQRGKDKLMGGEGLTPYERLAMEDRQQLEQLIREDQTGRILAELGLLPASTQDALISQPYVDPTTGMGVS